MYFNLFFILCIIYSLHLILITSEIVVTNDNSQNENVTDTILPNESVDFSEDLNSDPGIPSILLEASGRGDIEGIMQALHVHGERIDVLNVNGWSSAMFAAGGFHLDSLKLLVENGIDVNIQSHDGLTPLMLAVQNVCIFYLFSIFYVISYDIVI